MSEDRQRYIYVASIRLRNGKRIYARHYGKRAFRIAIRDDPNQRSLF